MKMKTMMDTRVGKIYNPPMPPHTPEFPIPYLQACKVDAYLTNLPVLVHVML